MSHLPNAAWGKHGPKKEGRLEISSGNGLQGKKFDHIHCACGASPSGLRVSVMALPSASHRTGTRRGEPELAPELASWEGIQSWRALQG